MKTDLINLSDHLLVKMELYHLSGSHKFRAANYIVEEAIRKGYIDRRTTIIEKTGGNFGFGLLAACLKRNIQVELAIGLNFSQEKKEMLQKLGANLIGHEMLDLGKTPKEVVEWHLLHQKQLGKHYFFTDQFNNHGSYLAHRQTGNEIGQQLKQQFPKVKQIIFVACAGTGASFSGIRDSLAEEGFQLKTILVEPEGCDSQQQIFTKHRLEGMSVGVCPPFMKWETLDERQHVSDEDISQIKSKIFAKHGVLVGNTSAACYEVATRYESECDVQRKVLTIFYDSGIWYR